MPDSFRIDNNMVGLSFFSVIDNIINNPLFVKIIFFRQKNIFRTVGHTAPKCDISRISSHYFDNTAPLMGGRSISYLINRLHRRIDRRVKAYRIIRTGNIQINRSGNPDRIDSFS